MQSSLSEPALSIRSLVKRFGGLTATDDLSLEIATGEVHAIIGPNGAGKTTLIAQLAGHLMPDSGRVYFAGEDITRLPPRGRAARGLARTFQITSLFEEFSALENVCLALQVRGGHSFRFLRPAAHDRELRAQARGRLEQVGLAARANIRASTLAHGEKRALELAVALAMEPRLLLLDEPMAGMGPDESQQMLRLLTALKGKLTMVLIEHDMDAVFALADRITVLVYGKAIATGAPDEIRRNPVVQEAYLGDED